MFENLTDRLERSFKLLKGEGKITEINIAETLKDIRRALLDADVNYSIAKKFTNDVKDKALGQNVLTSVKPGQMMVKIVKDELTSLMGGESSGIDLSGPVTVILMAGLQGSVKLPLREKLAYIVKNKREDIFTCCRRRIPGRIYRAAEVSRCVQLLLKREYGPVKLQKLQ